MRYFLFASFLLFASACKLGAYRDLKPVSNPQQVQAELQVPNRFDRVLYTCQVYGKKPPFGKTFNISGLLFFKHLDDGSTRVVFQNQMGLSYFDFGWDSKGDFKVYSIMEQMNKPALVKTLRKDFELLLKMPVLKTEASLLAYKNGCEYIKYNLNKGFVFYIFENRNIKLIENADEKRKVVVFDVENATGFNTLAPKIHINHLRAHFKIDLTQIVPEENPDTDASTTE